MGMGVGGRGESYPKVEKTPDNRDLTLSPRLLINALLDCFPNREQVDDESFKEWQSQDIRTSVESLYSPRDIGEGLLRGDLISSDTKAVCWC